MQIKLFPSPPSPRRLRRGLAAVLSTAALVALAPAPAMAAGGERGTPDSYRATCGHMGVPCEESEFRSKRTKAKRGCARAATRRAVRACRAKRTRHRGAVARVAVPSERG